MFKFTWRIENYSMLIQNTGEFIDSPTFELNPFNNAKAYIRLYPKGKNSDNYITYYLFMVNESHVFDVGTRVTFSFTKNSRSEHKELAVNLSNQRNLFHGVSKNLYEVDKFEDLFLLLDNVDIECSIRKKRCRGSPVICCGKTIVQIETHTHDLRLRKNIFNPSPLWESWCGYARSLSDNFKLFVYFQEMHTNNTIRITKLHSMVSAVYACFKISLIDSAGQKTALLCDGHLFKASEISHRDIPFTIEPTTMSNVANLCLEVIISEGKTVTADSRAEEESLTKIHSIESDNNCHLLLKNMYDTKKFSDVVLQVGTARFAAHKCVLGNVSDVFSAMFTNQMQEVETSVVNITDIDKAIVHKMLEFVYTGKTEKLDMDDMVNLYSAANKYQIEELKNLCSFRLTEILNVDNCLEVLELADMHQDDTLEEAARSFIYSNREDVLISSHWKNFMQRHLELAADIMFQICQLPSI